MELFPEESFKYANLDEHTRNIIWQYTSEIKDLMRLTAENIISIGQKLTQVKLQLGHGSFQQWLKSEFEWSEQTARQFMQVYRWSETIENRNFVFSQLGTSALYLLAAPSTPPEAREEVLDLVGGGEKVNYTRAKNIISRYKELPMAIDEDVAEIIDIEAELQTQMQPDGTNNLLFRLESSELGCIVRLYHAGELEAITNLSIGATVKIKIGRWQGKTATISEVLNEQQSIMTDSQQIDTVLSASSNSEIDLSLSEIDEIDLGDREKLREMGQHLIISYRNVCLAIKGDSQSLTAFTEQIRTNSEFLQNVFQQALNIQDIQT